VPEATPSTTARVAGWLPTGRERILWAVGAALVLLIVIALVASGVGGGAGKDPPSPGSTTTTPTTSRSPRPKVVVDKAQYVGKPVADVKAALAALGLHAQTTTVRNPGGQTAGTVADLTPSGSVKQNATITLDVWGAVPKVDHGGTGDKPKHKGHKGRGKH
jgi:serine/threonine-protein kinase